LDPHSEDDAGVFLLLLLLLLLSTVVLGLYTPNPKNFMRILTGTRRISMVVEGCARMCKCGLSFCMVLHQACLFFMQCVTASNKWYCLSLLQALFAAQHNA
jgi:hypothetical protein